MLGLTPRELIIYGVLAFLGWKFFGGNVMEWLKQLLGVVDSAKDAVVDAVTPGPTKVSTVGLVESWKEFRDKANQGGNTATVDKLDGLFGDLNLERKADGDKK